MNTIVAGIRAEMKAASDETVRASTLRFFKEEITCYGLKSAVVTRIARKYWKDVAPLSKREILDLCEELYRSDYCEEASVAACWVPELADRFEPEDFKIFERWIETYINNWAKCDCFCNHSMALFLDKYPRFLKDVKRWTASKNRWVRRAAAVSLIIPAREGRLLDDIFEIADRLLTDKDDLVQKGYGWLLKEASRKHTREVFDYVLANRETMPRTALRYAVELMPPALKAGAMRRDKA